MLKNLNENSKKPERVVLLGSNGFVGSSAYELLLKKGISVLPISREKIDLTQKDAGNNLAELINPRDTLLFVSAKAPVKNNEMLVQNILMAQSVSEAIQKSPVSHLIYISSDAVYSDNSGLLNESSPTEPNSLHGLMHLIRETMLKTAWNGAICILRPTLIYGDGDPHNGYGPNRFKRLIEKGEDISLFGNGEEQRDHVWIKDVAEIIALCVIHRSKGILNIATGKVVSFREIAEKLISSSRSKNKIISNPRVGEMPHNGYRAFDSSSTQNAFPSFRYHSLSDFIELNGYKPKDR